MAFLARAAMGAARSGAMKGGMGDSALSEGSGDLKKAKKLLEDIKSGKMSVGSLDSDMLKKLGGKEGIAKFINGEGGALDRFVGKSSGFEKLGIKPIDLSRNGFNEKNGIENPEKPKDSSDKISSKSRINGSLNVSKADYYDKNKFFDTENVEPVPTYTPKPGTDEVRLKGPPSEGDIKNLGKDFKKDLKELEKDTDKLEKDTGEKEDAGEGDFSIDTKHSLKNVTEVVKQYERIVGEDTKAIDDLQVAEEGLGKGPNINSVGNNSEGNQRLNNNRAIQNAKKGSIKHGSFSQTSTGPSSGGHSPTGGGPKQLKQNSKTGPYDPARGKVSGDGLGKPLDPFREKLKSLQEFYEKHENKFDALDSANQQFNQAAGNIDNVVGGALMAYARKELEEGLGENVPVGDGGSANNNNNNNNDTNSLIGDKVKEKLGFGENKDHKGSKATKDVVPHKASVKGVKGVRGKAGVGKSLESANSHHATGALEELKPEKSTVKDLFSKIHDLKKNNPYVKFVSGTSDQLRNVQDPTGEMLAKFAAEFGVSVPSDDNAGQQNNNNNGMDSIFSSKGKEKTPKTGSKRSKLDNSKVSKVEHHTNVQKLGHSGHSARIELSKGKTEEHTQEKSDFFDKGADPLKRDHRILEQKEGSSQEKGPNKKHELVEAETALEIEGAEEKAMNGHNIEETIATVRAIKDVEEFFTENDSRDQSEKTEIENAERENRQVGREEQRKEIEEIVQFNELSMKEDAVKIIEEKRWQEREGRREQREELVAGSMEQSREAVEERGEQEREAREQKEELVAGRMEQRKESIEEKRREDQEERKQKEREREQREMERERELVARKMEQRREEVEEREDIIRQKKEVIGLKMEKSTEEVEGHRVQRQEKSVGALEEIQTNLEEAQLKVEQTDQVNRKAAYPEQQKKGEISEGDVVGSEEVTAKLGSRVQGSGKEGKVADSEEVTAKLGSRVQADEWLVGRANEDEPVVQELSQSSKLAEFERVKVTVEEVRQQQDEGQQNRDKDFLQKQVNNSEKFLLDDAAVFEKKLSHSNEAGRSIGDPVEASLSKEAMLPSDSEVPQRRDSLIEAKGATVVGHNPGAEAMHHVEYHLDARAVNHVGHHLDTNVGDREKQDPGARVGVHVEHHLDTNVGDRVEQNLGARAGDRIEHHLDTNVGGRVEEDLKDEVKLENEQRTYSLRAESDQVTRDSSDVLGEQRESNQHTLEKRSLDQEAQVVETESVTNRAVPTSEAESVTNRTAPVSEISEVSEIAVTGPISDKEPEAYKKQEKNNTSNIVEQLKDLEDESVLEKIASKPDSRDENAIGKREHLQDNRNEKANQRDKDVEGLEEAKILASEHMEFSEKESETAKAARLEKDNFVSLFTGVAKPGLQTEIARNFGENVYREAKAGKEDIGELTNNIVKNSEKLTKDFTKYLQVEEKRIEAENSANRQWKSEAQIIEGIPAS